MKEQARNILVGLTVIVALILLGAMVLTFAGAPALLQRGFEIKMHFPATADAREGDPVHLVGIRVGRITDIRFTDRDPRKGVTLTARIDAGTKVPGNVNAYIFSRGLVGGAYVELKADGKERIDPDTGQAMDFLPTDRVTIIDGQIRTSVIPKELSELAKNLNELLTGEQPDRQENDGAQGTTSRPATRAGLKGAVGKLNRALDALNQVLCKENRKNLATSLKNLSEATADAKKTLGAVEKFADKAGRNVDDLTKKLLTDAEKMSALLDSISRMTAKINSGEGSAGKLINDPKLYNSLLESSEQLSQLLKEFRQLVKQWKEKGVGVKLK